MTRTRARTGVGSGPSRRAIVAGIGASGCLAVARPARAGAASVRIDDLSPGRAISPFIYGSNEVGSLDGGPLSADLDKLAGVTARRLGGNFMTTYNWTNNALNAGQDGDDANGGFWFDTLQIPESERARPAIVIETMHAGSLAMGARSILTVPLAGYVAADLAGHVAPEDAAPSARFVPVRWSLGATPGSPIDPSVADIPHLISRLVAQYGDAASGRGFVAYALDNEPGLWSKTHPRVVGSPMTIEELLRRSIEAATAIKKLDPSAKVFGPASWGATEMVNFQNAADWPMYRQHGSFLAAYLAAFRGASERAGMRLLDVLDVHWYAYSSRGNLYRTEDPSLDAAILAAPRSLTERGFVEDSWVPRALAGQSGPPGSSIGLPLLPSLNQLVEHAFPGTGLALTEFNYGGAGQLSSGLAVADALGRFGASGLFFASHWGSLAGWLGEAYRLYRTPDSASEPFGSISLPLGGPPDPDLRVYAARSATQPARVQIVVINAAAVERSLDVGFASARAFSVEDVLGFDAETAQTSPLPKSAWPADGGSRLAIPGRAARRFVFRLA